MRIVTPTGIDRVAWEGELATASGAPFKARVTLPRVTLGEPAWWPAEVVMQGAEGKPWVSPADGRRYTLVRLACTLHEPADARTRFAEATLATRLRPRQGQGSAVAYDLCPQRLAVESKGRLTFGLKPDLKFAQVEIGVGEVGAEIEFVQAFPIIQAYGLGERTPYWQFARHAAHPLLGCQAVYLVLAAPQDAGGVQLGVELTGKVETRIGPFSAALPEAARARTSWVIG